MYNKIANIILRIRPATVSLSPETRLVEDIGLDSLGLLEFSAMIEDQFGIVFEGNHFHGVRTLSDVCNRLGELLAFSAASAGATETGAP